MLLRNFGQFGLVLMLILTIWDAPHTMSAQTANDDLLRLDFDDGLNGQQGQKPFAMNGAPHLETGITGQALHFFEADNVLYAATGNIDPTIGTLDFFVRPDWRGDDGAQHHVLSWGTAGGLVFAKDGANNLRSIFNRFGANGEKEVGVAVNVADWKPNQWHYVAFTWSTIQKRLRLYIDGVQRAEESFTITLPAIVDPHLFIGSDSNGTSRSLDGTLDMLRISGLELSSVEIAQRAAAYTEQLAAIAAAVPATIDCPQALPSRLTIGGTANIDTSGANNLRAEPGLQGKIVGKLAPGALVLTLSAPVCADRIVWWQVELLGSGAGTVGWTAEGESHQYFLIPVRI